MANKPRQAQRPPVQKPVQQQQSILPQTPKPEKKENVMRVKFPQLAGRVITSSYRKGDDEIPVQVKLDDEGVSEEITIEAVYNELLQCGFEAA